MKSSTAGTASSDQDSNARASVKVRYHGHVVIVYAAKVSGAPKAQLAHIVMCALPC